MKTTFCILFVIAMISSIVSGHSLAAEKLDKIAAIVNSDVITEEEVATFMKMTDMAQESGLNVADPKVLRRQLLERMVEDRLILQAAKDAGLKPDEKMVEDRIREIKARAGSELAFNMALKQQGISLSDLRQKFKNQLLIFMEVQREVRSKVQVSPKEVTEYYEAHPDEFVDTESAVVDSIFVKDQDVLAKVESLLDEGKDFNEVERQYSQKASLGVVFRGQLKKELEDEIFGLKTGVRSKPISVEDGTYIFLLREIKPASKKDMSQVKDAIVAMLEDKKTEKRLKEWLEALKEKAYISIRED